MLLVPLLASCTGVIERDPPGEVPGDESGISRPGPNGTGGGAAPGSSLAPDQAFLGPAALRRLTPTQYVRALEGLFGAGPVAAAKASLVEPEARFNGLASIGASRTALSAQATEQHAQVVDAIVVGALGDPTRRASLVGCDPAQPACVTGFLTRFGRRAWRRPLEPEERDRYAALAALGARKMGDAWMGLRFALSAMLQSPHFLYRVELGRPDPARPARRQLGPHELASRLSFLLVDQPPDDPLLDAADSGQLTRPEILEAQARRLLSSAGAVPALEGFYEDYLDLASIADLPKAAAAFPQFTAALKQQMRLETVRTLRVLTFDENQDFREVFTSRTTFLMPDLARLYGLTMPPGPTPVRASYPESGPRAGLLTHASLLSLNAHETMTSPTLRGKFIRETLLCQSIPDPPPDVEAVLPKPAGRVTTRQRFEQHSTDPACSGCHSLMDPLGLGLENFDAIGRYRDRENDLPIDAAGKLDGVAFSGSAGLAEAVARHPRVPGCFATILLRHAAGDLLETEIEQALASEIERRFGAARFSVRALLLEIVTHPGFRHVRSAD